VVLPYTKVGVIGGVMLGLGRALGETMAVTFVIRQRAPPEPVALRAGQFDRLRARQRVHRGGGGLYTSALIELGLILFLITTDRARVLEAAADAARQARRGADMSRSAASNPSTCAAAA
jgi:ABC-type phosphate transport system permease subunit